MSWQTSAKVLKDIVALLEEKNKEFLSDYVEMIWELSVADDGSYWLNAWNVSVLFATRSFCIEVVSDYILIYLFAMIVRELL